MQATDKFHAKRVRFSRTWIDSSGQFGNSLRKFSENDVALPMLAMETEMKTQRETRGDRGFTRMELIVVICVIALVGYLLLFVFAAEKHLHSRISCVNNLKQIGFAFQFWEGDNGDKYPMQVSVTNGGAMELAFAGNVSAIFRVMSNELSAPIVLICPQDAGWHYATNFTTDLNRQTISYFVGLDAEEKYPQMILSGDDNLTVNGVRVQPGILNLSTNASVGWTKERHGGAGNIALTDGSVQTTTASALQSALVNTGFATNRLVIP
jgi:prepilin-type processing-associated H-X9-DG protein